MYPPSGADDGLRLPGYEPENLESSGDAVAPQCWLRCVPSLKSYRQAPAESRGSEEDEAQQTGCL